MRRIEYEMSSWRTRVIHWLVDGYGYQRFWAALTFEKDNFEGLELTRKMGAIWNLVYYEAQYTKRWAMVLYVARMSLNNLMRDVVSIIDKEEQ